MTFSKEDIGYFARNTYAIPTINGKSNKYRRSWSNYPNLVFVYMCKTPILQFKVFIEGDYVFLFGSNSTEDIV